MELDAFVRDQILRDVDPMTERAGHLAEIAKAIRASLDAFGHAKLLFICTHNSRRSQLAQVWAAVAAHWYGIDGVQSFSGGTEVTAFHPNAVEALRQSGLEIAIGSGANPLYQVSFSPDSPPLHCFSKHFGHPDNPSSEFIALMTCAEADAGCPIVPGAWKRMGLSYEDPKISDGTDLAEETYFNRSLQIAREQFAIFSQIPSQADS